MKLPAKRVKQGTGTRSKTDFFQGDVKNSLNEQIAW